MRSDSQETLTLLLGDKCTLDNKEGPKGPFLFTRVIK